MRYGHYVWLAVSVVDRVDDYGAYCVSEERV